MQIISPDHQFGSFDAFLATFQRLSDNGRVNANALAISGYCTSIRVKLHGGKTHLENMLAIKTWTSTPATQNVPSYVTTGSTITLGGTASAPILTIQAMNFSLALDGFFENLVTALDYLAQVVNLVYFAPPHDADNVTFHKIVEFLINDPAKHNETITRQLATMRKSSWYRNMKPFRRCATHHKSIDYSISYKQSSFQPLRESIASYDVRTILLPDKPLSADPSYDKKRSVQTFCVGILRAELDKINDAFRLLETRITNAGQVPV